MCTLGQRVVWELIAHVATPNTETTRQRTDNADTSMPRARSRRRNLFVRAGTRVHCLVKERAKALAAADCKLLEPLTLPLELPNKRQQSAHTHTHTSAR
eukprot:5566444-Alexandrium_andersonii.AAC.1